MNPLGGLVAMFGLVLIVIGISGTQKNVMEALRGARPGGSGGNANGGGQGLPWGNGGTWGGNTSPAPGTTPRSPDLPIGPELGIPGAPRGGAGIA